MKRLLCLAALAASPVTADPAIILTPDTTLDWQTTPDSVAFAPLSGDREAEAYFAMVRLPAGTISPAHTKSATIYRLLAKGEMTHAAPATDAATIGPGADYEIPADMPHMSACVSATPCLTLLYQDGPFDFVPVTP
ncbi:MAG: hypothetical protein AAFZ14_05970 [Pseudomonadota bacterium]